jgi:hypothetical protein
MPKTLPKYIELIKENISTISYVEYTDFINNYLALKNNLRDMKSKDTFEAVMDVIDTVERDADRRFEEIKQLKIVY